MQALIGKREKLYSSTQKDYAERKNAIEQLSREAKTLMYLLARLRDAVVDDDGD